MDTFLGLLIPFLGTALGAACVFFMKKELSNKVQRALSGFAAGVMVAASIWSLIIPAMEQSEDMGRLAFLPAAIGFWAGVLFLLLLDHVIPHLHLNTDKSEGPKSKLEKTTMMVLAVTLHNIPEGMAVVLYTQDISLVTERWHLAVRWRCQSVLRSKTSRKARSSPCHFMRKGKVRSGHSVRVLFPASWNRSAVCSRSSLQDF